jgi:serine protease Do
MRMTKGSRLFVPTLAALAALAGVGVGLALKNGDGSQAGWAARVGTLDSVAMAQDRPPGPTPDLLSFADVAERVSPSVVTLRSARRVRAGQRDDGGPGLDESLGDDFFQRFFGQIPDRDRTVRGLGSGFVVDPNGIILTNNHVVAGADDITVRFADGREEKGRVVGTDPESDVAVVRVEATGLPALRFGDADAIRVGEWVLAIGSPFGQHLEHSVTAGIISAKGRSSVGLADYEDFLQTDAAINPGNSGGPLVNLRGEVIGMNTAIASRSGGYQGVGFAIPINMAERIMRQLLDNGKVTRSFLGVSIQELTPAMARGLGIEASQGIVVADVVAQSPAARAGIEEGDVILSLDGEEATGVSQFRNRIAATRPGTRVRLETLRDGRRREVQVELDEKQTDEVAARGRGDRDPGPDAALGMEFDDLSSGLAQRFEIDAEPGDGVVVTGVQPGSTAAEAGLRAGDLVRAVNGQRVKNSRDLRAKLRGIADDDPVVLLVRRADQSFYVTLTHTS